ncbi:hypothetical protein [Sporolactobacillus putidus]|nr:hypothetical protein [Sporolactobacillus putidus]
MWNQASFPDLPDTPYIFGSMLTDMSLKKAARANGSGIRRDRAETFVPP